MKYAGSCSTKIWPAGRVVLGALLFWIGAASWAVAAAQGDVDVPPDATPQIQQVNPAQAAPGAHVTVTLQGSNFSAGAYVSSVSAALHVDSSKRISATQLEAQVSVTASAQPSAVSLLVSNPASRAAEVAFTIVAAAAAPAPATPPASPVPAAPPTPAAPTPPPAPAPTVAPAPPAPEVKPSALATPAVHAAPPAAAPVASTAPEVAAVIPPRVSQGFDVDLKITGRNFGHGAKVSFSNSGIRSLGVTSSSSTEITVHIKVATDAPTGKGSLFVINSDDNEAEAAIEVTAKGGGTPSAPGAPAPTVAAVTQRFDAFHLGNPTEIFHVHGRVKGSLVLSAGTVKYEEDGKTLINVSVRDIKEVKTSTLPGTFHITLASGKTYHFAAGSARPSDARLIVDAIQKAMPH